MPKTLREMYDYLNDDINLDNIKELERLESELWYSEEEVKKLLKSHKEGR